MEILGVISLTGESLVGGRCSFLQDCLINWMVYADMIPELFHDSANLCHEVQEFLFCLSNDSGVPVPVCQHISQIGVPLQIYIR